MPIYEFRCGECGACFEALVAVGSETESCRDCGAAGASRVLSRPADPLRIVKTGSEMRRQEERNRKLREATKRAFSERRRRAREATRARKPGGAAP